MSGTAQAILDVVNANDGRMLWQALKDALPAGEQRRMVAGFYELKRDGLLARQNRVVDGELLFEVYVPGQ